MKKSTRVLCLLLSLLMLLPLCACGKKGEGDEVEIPDGFALAENKNTDYYFFYPANWTLDRNDAGMTSAFVSESDYSNISITAFTASAEYPTLLSYAENYYFVKFQDNFNNLEVEKNQDKSLKKSTLKIDGCDALAVNFSATFSQESYSFRAWFISYNGYIYTVLYTAKTEVFDSHLEEAEAVAKALKFK